MILSPLQRLKLPEAILGGGGMMKGTFFALCLSAAKVPLMDAAGHGKGQKAEPDANDCGKAAKIVGSL